MQELHLYEYAIIRLVPRVDREEFINIGVIVYCKERSYLDCKYHLNEKRIQCLTTKELDFDELKAHLDSFVAIAKGEKINHPISRLDPGSRFRWLTAIRSTIIQSSRIHPGRSIDPAKAFENLFEKMVL
ncbi:Protein of unknown function [Arachidicoccus rhizosphaerae]|uniref:DUF3037 domain-containing protein n=1 Tax=Arachidicoccus rhizosphaerae TaxID=551991 RepID=A0A1H3W069_9BACT|nr:DUF3037 domain-containing protein [Arachidicoccus rhizosphaerae]SDZ80449.1 Protein of unknown function [Arachidicoccus rhizosphaerae]